MINRINGYDVEYFEEENRDSFIWEYRPIVKVYKDNELILSSKNKEEEEFLNYLSFLIDDKRVLEYIKDKEYLMDNDVYTDDDYCSYGSIICNDIDDIYI